MVKEVKREARVATRPRAVQGCPPVVIDTREQAPLEIPGAVRGTLKSGDYSLRGYEDRVAVERKSLNDLYGSLGQGRARFERCVRRLSQLEAAAIVVEASLEDVVDRPPRFSEMSPRAVARTACAWSVKYGVPVQFCSSPRLAAAWVRGWLEFVWLYRLDPLRR